MQFGIYLLFPTHQSRPLREVYLRAIEIAQVAEVLGFKSIVVQNYPFVFLPYLAAKTRKIKIQIQEPARLADEVPVLADLSHDRFEVIKFIPNCVSIFISYNDSLVQTKLQSQIAGTPNQCIEQMKLANHLPSPSTFYLNFWFDEMPQQEVLQSMELFTKEVMPAFIENKMERLETP